jgi:crotonobetainyl-CoA:carnitine CoA-transferase CaiB-like acyl-CoA transferase
VEGTLKMAGAQNGPLAGMRVIELAHIMAGPVCGLMLADLGADVVKVEKAGRARLRRAR